jgi:hypothetical protein
LKYDIGKILDLPTRDIMGTVRFILLSVLRKKKGENCEDRKGFRLPHCGREGADHENGTVYS